MAEHKIIERLRLLLKEKLDRDFRMMEICGTHTQAIAKAGLRSFLPQGVSLLSGPGCPVCVTPESILDAAVHLSATEGVEIITFGDMLRVKGAQESLEDRQREGAQISVIYSPEEALVKALNNRERTYIFVAVGFETTAPLIAALVKQTAEKDLKNLCFLTSLKRMEPVIRQILGDERCRVDAMICPGHVAVIQGAGYFRFITESFGIPAVICGFQRQEVAAGICMLIEQLMGKRPRAFVNLYGACVREGGNPMAQACMAEVFDVTAGDWRGIGSIQNSALVLKARYAHLDALKRFGIQNAPDPNPAHCLCSEILLGLKLPSACPLFGKGCTPQQPAGPCMVAFEGACAAHYRYGGSEADGGVHSTLPWGWRKG